MTSEVVSEPSFLIAKASGKVPNRPPTFIIQQPLRPPPFIPSLSGPTSYSTVPAVQLTSLLTRPVVPAVPGRGFGFPLYSFVSNNTPPPVNISTCAIEELRDLDHSYALPPSKEPIPALSLPEALQIPPSTPDLPATTGFGASSSVETEAPTLSPSLSVATASQKNSTKSRKSGIKYINVGDNKKEKPGRPRKDKSIRKTPNPETTSPKLESLLKAPIRNNSEASTSAPPLLLNKFDNNDEFDADIDVETLPPTPKIKYDAIKARNLMNECEKFVNFARPTDVPENWESLIVKIGWTTVQKRLFDQIIKILHKDHLSRLSYVGHPAEPILRRLLVDKTSQLIRRALAKIAWDCKLTQWLHGILKDNLSWDYLASYMDVLQTLRAKVPSLVDRMILLSTTSASSNPSCASAPSSSTELSQLNSNIPPEQSSPIVSQSAEALNFLLKRQWDPFANVVKQTKGKKLKYDPIFLLVPCTPSWGNPISPRRTKSFLSILSTIGKSIIITVSQSNVSRTSVDEFTDQIIQASRGKLYETKANFPDRPVFLIGWGPGGVIAATIALTEKVAGVICLGFPLFTLRGIRGDTNYEPLWCMKLPLLFVVGSQARNSNVPDMDKFRRRLNCPSSLVVIQDGDDYLNVKSSKRKELLVTQSCIDKNVVEEILAFISLHCTESILASLKSPPLKISSPTKLSSFSLPVSPRRINLPSPKQIPCNILDSIPGSHSMKNDDSLILNKTNGFGRMQMYDEYDFDDSKKIPSNTSSSRRKAYYRASNSLNLPIRSNSIENPVTPSTITASQLVVHHASNPPSNVIGSQLVQQTSATFTPSTPPNLTASQLLHQAILDKNMENGNPQTLGDCIPTNGITNNDSSFMLNEGNRNLEVPSEKSRTSSVSLSFSSMNGKMEPLNSVIRNLQASSPSLTSAITTATASGNLCSSVKSLEPSNCSNYDTTSVFKVTKSGFECMSSPINGNLYSHHNLVSSIDSSSVSSVELVHPNPNKEEVCSNSTEVCSSTGPNFISSSEIEQVKGVNGMIQQSSSLISGITTTTTSRGDVSMSATSNSDTSPSQVMRTSTTTIRATEIERLNSVLLSKCSTDLSRLLASGKTVLVKKTLVKKPSNTLTHSPIIATVSEPKDNSTDSLPEASTTTSKENNEEDSSPNQNLPLVCPTESIANSIESSDKSLKDINKHLKNEIHNHNETTFKNLRSRSTKVSESEIPTGKETTKTLTNHNSSGSKNGSNNVNNTHKETQNNHIDSEIPSFKNLRSRTCKLNVNDSEATEHLNSSSNNTNHNHNNNKLLGKRKSSSLSSADNSSKSASDGSSTTTDSEYIQEDDFEDDAGIGPDSRRKQLKKIFPVTPASLSSTRTRKLL